MCVNDILKHTSPVCLQHSPSDSLKCIPIRESFLAIALYRYVYLLTYISRLMWQQDVWLCGAWAAEDSWKHPDPRTGQSSRHGPSSDHHRRPSPHPHRASWTVSHFLCCSVITDTEFLLTVSCDEFFWEISWIRIQLSGQRTTVIQFNIPIWNKAKYFKKPPHFRPIC